MDLKNKSKLPGRLLTVQISIFGFIILHSILWHVFGIHYLTKLCPASFADHVGNLEFNLTVVFWALVFLSTLFVGRAFCSWGCMFGSYQDMIARLFVKLKLNPFTGRTGAWILPILLFLFTAPVLFISRIRWPSLFWFVVIVVSAGLLIWSIVERNQMKRNLFTLPKYIALANYLGGIVSTWIILNVFQKGFSFAFDKHGVLDEYKSTAAVIIAALTLCMAAIGVAIESRFYCRYLCPYGLLLRFLSAIPFTKRFKVRASGAKCSQCGKCNKNCPMELDPMDEINKHGEIKSPDCISCLQCVASCPKDALDFSNKLTVK